MFRRPSAIAVQYYESEACPGEHLKFLNYEFSAFAATSELPKADPCEHRCMYKYLMLRYPSVKKLMMFCFFSLVD